MDLRRHVWAITAAVLIAAFLIGGAVAKDGTLFGPTVASWVQAIGSIAAILVTAVIFVADRGSRTEAEQKRIADLARVVSQMSLHAAELVSARLTSALETKVLFALRGRQTTEMVQAMREIDVKDLPPDIVKHFAYVRSGIYAVNGRISDVYDGEKADGRKIAHRRKRLMSAGRVFHQTLQHLENLCAATGQSAPSVARSNALREFIEDALVESESSEEARLD